MLLEKLAASILANALTGIGVIRAGHPTHPLTNFEIQKVYQNKPKFNGIYSRNNLSKKNDGTYIINLNEYEPIGTHYV